MIPARFHAAALEELEAEVSYYTEISPMLGEGLLRSVGRYLLISLALEIPIGASAGAWESGSFDNDDAMDWVATCARSSGTSAIGKTLEMSLESAYLEAPEASEAIAAAEVVAAARGKPSPKLPKALGAWLQGQSKEEIARLAPIASRESDSQVRLLVYPEYGFDPVKGSYPIRPPDLAVSESVFRFSGRVGKDTLAAQPGFDSFMTLGLAETFLVPKALLERARQDDSLLAVWFDSQGRALAYKWVRPREPSPR